MYKVRTCLIQVGFVAHADVLERALAIFYVNETRPAEQLAWSRDAPAQRQHARAWAADAEASLS